MNYILVQSGQIVGRPKPLPKSWANISNFHLMDNQSLKQYGWYPFTFVEIEISSNQVYDGSEFVIGENEVTEYQKVRDKTEDEILNDIENEWNSIRLQRNMLLSESDWTQLSDSPLTIEKQNEWKIYRQELRDITKQSNPFSISWPIKPEA